MKTTTYNDGLGESILDIFAFTIAYVMLLGIETSMIIYRFIERILDTQEEIDRRKEYRIRQRNRLLEQENL